MQPERRKHGRRNTALLAIVLPYASAGAIRCTIRDISEGGARLQTAELASVPDTFDVLIHTPDGKVQRRRCKVMWRADNQLGLSFQK